MEPVRVCVTGGTGFTGTALVRRLLDEGHDVVALDKQEGLGTDRLREEGAEVVLGSVTDPDVVDRAVEGAEVVHHLAAAFRELDVPESHYDEVNVGGTRNVMEAARRHGVRKVVYCSTCGVHGNVDDPPADEDSPVEPEDYYQRTKYEGELVVGEYGDELDTVILRPAAIYGPGDPERFFLIFERVASGWFPMFGDGETLYHPLYIDNLVDAFLLAMGKDEGNGGTYLIADEEYVAIEELVRSVADAMGVDVRVPHFPVTPLVVLGHVVEKACRPLGVEPPIFPRRVDWYRQDRAFDISRARRDLGYRPRVDLDEGLRRTWAWYRDHGYL